jgi:glucose-6-phosphate 1-dehydrogenase
MTQERSDALVFFGATGDLAFKQIYPALYALTLHGRLDMPVVAVGRKELGTGALREKVKEALEKNGNLDTSAVFALLGHLQYVAVDDGDATSFGRIRDALGSRARRPLHYMALPPESFAKTAEGLAKVDLSKNARIAVEKPFGRDLASAKELSRKLHEFFDEEAIYRLDHFLGKEAVENIVYFRAANPLIERAMNATEVLSIQITMAETFGVKGRAKFYDPVGAIRDVVQNHLLEVVACLTMDLPTGRGHAPLRDARSQLLGHVRALAPTDVVRGQVRGYKDEQDVAKDSTTETFAALRLSIDAPRWSGVPIFIRAGKGLRVTATEAVVRLKTRTHPILDETSAPAPNQVRFRIGPDMATALSANVKRPGESMSGEMAELTLRHTEPGSMKAYERLLGDAMDGDPTAFARLDAVEESWRIVDPILDNATPVHEYDTGTWGPDAAKSVSPEWGWHDPA